MSEQDKNRARAMAKVEATLTHPAAQHVLNVFKAVLANFPVGASITSLMTDYIPSAQMRRLEEFASRTAEDLRRLQDRVDFEYLKTDEFAYLFEQCFRGAAENYQREKLDAFRAILVNSAVSKCGTQTEREYFLNLVNRLSALHLRIASFVLDPVEYCRRIGIPPEELDGCDVGGLFVRALPDVLFEAIQAAYGDLYQQGLLSTDKHVFQTKMSQTGPRVIAGRVTQLARRFLEFCAIPD